MALSQFSESLTFFYWIGFLKGKKLSQIFYAIFFLFIKNKGAKQQNIRIE